MKPNTALCFVLSGIALWLFNKYDNLSFRKKIFFSVCSFFILTIGLLTLAEYFFNVHFGIDEWHVNALISGSGTFSPERMSPVSAFNFCLVGSILFFLRHTKENYKIPQLLTIILFSTSLLTVSEDIFGEDGLYGIASYTKIALHASIGFIILSIGLIASQKNSKIIFILSNDIIGGTVTRILIPLIIFLPLLFGWLRLKGEHYGLYGTKYGVALFSTSVTLFLLTLLFRKSHLIIAAENKKKIAEDELKKSNERFLKIFNSNPIASVISRADDGRIIYANVESEKIYRQKRENMIGKTAAEFKWVSLEEREKIRKYIEEKKGGAIKNITIKLSVGNGEIKDVLYSIETLEIDGKKCFLSCAIDITEQKKTEFFLKQKSEELELANKELEHFGYVASHDLQEPLRTVTNFIGLLQKKNIGNSDKDIPLYFSFIVNAVSKMQTLIKELLVFSRVGRNITFEAVDFNEILKDVMRWTLQLKIARQKLPFPNFLF